MFNKTKSKAKRDRSSSPSSLSIYVRTISKFPVFSKEEELQIFRDYNTAKKEKNTAEEHRIFTKIVNSNLRLVVFEAKRWCSKNGLPMQDLIQAGNLGLLRSVQKFKISKKVRFATYAMYWIKATLGRFVIQRSSVVTAPISKVGLRALPKTISLDTGGTGEDSLQDILLKDETDELDLSIDRQQNLVDLRKILYPIISSLNPLDQDIVLHRFMSDPEDRLTLRQIGAKHGFVGEAVRQKELRLIERLRKYLSDFNDSLQSSDTGFCDADQRRRKVV